MAELVVAQLALTDAERAEAEAAARAEHGGARGADACEPERRRRVVAAIAAGLRAGERQSAHVAAGMLAVADLLGGERGAQKRARHDVLERLRSAAQAIARAEAARAAAAPAQAEPRPTSAPGAGGSPAAEARDAQDEGGTSDGSPAPSGPVEGEMPDTMMR